MMRLPHQLGLLAHAMIGAAYGANPRGHMETAAMERIVIEAMTRSVPVKQAFASHRINGRTIYVSSRKWTNRSMYRPGECDGLRERARRVRQMQKAA